MKDYPNKKQLLEMGIGSICVVCPVENQDCDVCRMDEAMDDLETIIKFREYNNKIDSTQTANKRRRL